MAATDAIPNDLAWMIQRELNLNQEVLVMRAENAERREKLRQMLEAETVPDKIGLTRMPFSMKKLPSEHLREKIADTGEDIREKVKQWQGLKSEIEQKIEAYFLGNDQAFISVCRAFGIIAESRAILVNLRNRIADYLARTGQIRGAMAAGYNTATQTFSKQALETMGAAVESGYAADGIVLKLQERENQFSNLVTGTFAKNLSLPEFYTLNLGDFTDGMKNMPLEASNQAVTKAVTICDTVLKQQIPTYESALAQVEEATRQACLAHIEAFWQSLRGQVWAQLQQIKPMPQSANMTTMPAPQPKPETQEVDAMEAVAESQPSTPGEDTGRGLSNDYFEKPAERRSRLKLRTPSNS